MHAHGIEGRSDLRTLIRRDGLTQSEVSGEQVREDAGVGVKAKIRVKTRVKVDGDDGDLMVSLKLKAKVDTRVRDGHGDDVERSVTKLRFKLDARIDAERSRDDFDDESVKSLQATFAGRVSGALDAFQGDPGFDGNALLSGLTAAFDFFHAALGAVLGTGGAPDPSETLPAETSASPKPDTVTADDSAVELASASADPEPAAGGEPAPTEVDTAVSADGSAASTAETGFESLLAALREVFDRGIDELGLLLESTQSEGSLRARFGFRADTDSAAHLRFSLAYSASASSRPDEGADAASRIDLSA